MVGEVRARMVQGAADLLALGGPAAASVPKVLERTGAPRGSIYHYFPDGKDELHASAIDLTSGLMHDALERSRGRSAADVVRAYFAMWIGVVERSDFHAGCVATAVMVAEESPALRTRAADAFQTQQEQLTDLLTTGGLPADEAAPFATVLIAGAEGAVLLSRARGSAEPLTTVRDHLLAALRTA